MSIIMNKDKNRSKSTKEVSKKAKESKWAFSIGVGSSNIYNSKYMV
jgi:hypothetical protein